MAKDEATLVPTDDQGKPIEQDEKSKLKHKNKDQLIEMIEAGETKHKKVLTRNKNLKEELEDAHKTIERMNEELVLIRQQQEDTHEEAAQMSETIRIKNRIIDEVVDAYLALANTTRTTATQGLKILEYNGLVSNPTNRKGRE